MGFPQPFIQVTQKITVCSFFRPPPAHKVLNFMNVCKGSSTHFEITRHLLTRVNICGSILSDASQCSCQSVTCARYQSVYKRMPGPRSPSSLQPPDPDNEGPLPPRPRPRLRPPLRLRGRRSPAWAGCCWRQVEPHSSHSLDFLAKNAKAPPYIFPDYDIQLFSEDLDSCWLWADSGAGPPALPLAMLLPPHAPGWEILFRALTSELVSSH